MVSVSGISPNSGSCLDALDTELRRMIQQVRDVLPQVPVSAVKQDLGKQTLYSEEPQHILVPHYNIIQSTQLSQTTWNQNVWFEITVV